MSYIRLLYYSAEDDGKYDHVHQDGQSHPLDKVFLLSRKAGLLILRLIFTVGLLLRPFLGAKIIIEVRGFSTLIRSVFIRYDLYSIKFSCVLKFTHPSSLILPDGFYSLHFKVTLGWARWLLPLAIDVNRITVVGHEALYAWTFLVKPVS